MNSTATVQKLRQDTGIVIEKGVPLPAPHRCGAPAKYPWETMEISDSFVFPPPMIQESAMQMASRAARRYGKKFAVRKQPDGTIRCWRVE